MFVEAVDDAGDGRDQAAGNRRVPVGHGLAARFGPQASDVDVGLEQRRGGLPGSVVFGLCSVSDHGSTP